MHTVRIATNPRKWRRPAPCPACRQSQPLILTLGTWQEREIALAEGQMGVRR